MYKPRLESEDKKRIVDFRELLATHWKKGIWGTSYSVFFCVLRHSFHYRSKVVVAAAPGR